MPAVWLCDEVPQPVRSQASEPLLSSPPFRGQRAEGLSALIPPLHFYGISSRMVLDLQNFPKAQKDSGTQRLGQRLCTWTLATCGVAQDGDCSGCSYFNLILGVDKMHHHHHHLSQVWWYISSGHSPPRSNSFVGVLRASGSTRLRGKPNRRATLTSCSRASFRKATSVKRDPISVKSFSFALGKNKREKGCRGRTGVQFDCGPALRESVHSCH